MKYSSRDDEKGEWLDRDGSISFEHELFHKEDVP